MPPRAIEREHVLGAEAFPQRLLGDQCLELADDVALMPEREVGLDPQFDCGQTKLLEPRALVPGEGLREFGQRGAAPERERLTQLPRRVLRITLRKRAATVCELTLETGEVELVFAHLELVAGLACVQSRLG